MDGKMRSEEAFSGTKETSVVVMNLESPGTDIYDELKGHGRLLHIAIHSQHIHFCV